MLRALELANCREGLKWSPSPLRQKSMNHCPAPIKGSPSFFCSTRSRVSATLKAECPARSRSRQVGKHNRIQVLVLSGAGKGLKRRTVTSSVNVFSDDKDEAAHTGGSRESPSTSVLSKPGTTKIVVITLSVCHKRTWALTFVHHLLYPNLDSGGVCEKDQTEMVPRCYQPHPAVYLGDLKNLGHFSTTPLPRPQVDMTLCYEE